MIHVEQKGNTPKYKQIIQAVEEAIANQEMKRHDQLPSVNQIALKYNLSRDTVLLAYADLKKRGIIYAKPGKGYFVKSEDVALENRIFLLFDELNTFKEDLYQSFIKNIGKHARVDLFFHYFNINIFKKLIYENNDEYSHYVIMPTFFTGIQGVLNTLPENSVYILDQMHHELEYFPSVYQHFEKDIYDGLLKLTTQLKKYEKLIFLDTDFKQPEGFKIGFKQFCDTHHFTHEIATNLSDNIETKAAYIIPNDRDLVHTIELANTKKLVIGKDIGIVSYNETPLKKVVHKGITTISTDFNLMGKTIAEMIIKKDKSKIANTSNLIIRKSI